MRAYLVVGAESTGTRLVTQLLIAAGCEGDAGHEQRWDSYAPNGQTPIVWRRSYPHAGSWPRVSDMVRDGLWEDGYDVTIVVMQRDWWATARSQVRHGHVQSVSEAMRNLQAAYARIFSQMDIGPGPRDEDLDYVVVTYESLVRRPQLVAQWLWRHLALDVPVRLPVMIYDGNAPYYHAGGDILDGYVTVVWNGPHVARRVVGEYVWEADNGWRCDVAVDDLDVVMAADSRLELRVRAGGEVSVESGKGYINE